MTLEDMNAGGHEGQQEEQFRSMNQPELEPVLLCAGSFLVGDPGLQLARDCQVALGVHPRYRYAVFLGVADDFRGSSAAPGLLAVPDGDDRVAAVHHVASGSLVGLVAIQPARGLPLVASPGQQAPELMFGGIALEVLGVLLGVQRQRHLQPGIMVGQ